MYELLHFLRNFPYRRGAKMEDRTSEKRGIGENEFIYSLLEDTNYAKDWRQSLVKISRRFGMPIKVSRAGVKRTQNRNQIIELAIQGCREKGYLEPKDVNGNIKITSKGWRFSGIWGVGFLSECLGENKLLLLILGAVIGGIITMLLQKAGIL